MKSLRWIMIYTIVASVALWAAFNLSFSLFGRSQAQSTDLREVPAEMLDQTATPPQGAPPVDNLAAESGAVPAPPPQAFQDNGEVGDGATAPTEIPANVSDAEAPYNYSYDGKRDPFEPFRKIKASMQAAAPSTDNRAEVDLLPLERWELERIKIVAILWDIKNPRAVVVTPEGATHTVTKGTKIGRNFGIIQEIREGAIVVAEKVFIDGNAKTEIQTMELR